jgi:DNA-binding winged helix-turn-helix (wHTH) protein
MNLQFGDFVLDVDARRLLHRGPAQAGHDAYTDVHLSPKAFELLKALVENYPRALSKAELHERLWHGIFVSEGNLALLMTEIRTALGDNARDPRYIRTLHGFGYAFKAEVSNPPPAAIAPEADGKTQWLVWESRSYRLAGGENVIGRNPDSQVVLDVPGVSRRHACITIDRGIARIRDLGSKNGTIVRGQRITSDVELHDRDQVEIGPVTLTYREMLPVRGTETFTLMREPSASSRQR